MNPILCEIHRGGFLESRHRGALAVVASDGRNLLALGDVETPCFPRSALKPLQALPLLIERVHEEMGLTDRQITLLCASHGGDEEAVREVQAMLEHAGIPVAALACGTHPPLDGEARDRLARRGGPPTPLHHNCSGKHAGMLLLARRLGAPLEGYTDPSHPVQVRIRAAIARFAGLAPDRLGVAVDGCSAPAWHLPLRTLALALARLAVPDGMPAPDAAGCRRIFEAVTQEPGSLSAPRMLDQALVRAGRGRLLAKRGAEGVLAIALRPAKGRLLGLGFAIKVEDGDARGYLPAALCLVEQAGIDWRELAPGQLPPGADGRLRNHRGLDVGEIRAGAVLENLPAFRAD